MTPKHEAKDAMGMESQSVDHETEAFKVLQVIEQRAWALGDDQYARLAKEAKDHLSRATTQPAEQSASSPVEGEWQPMTFAPRDGTEIETLCVHPTAHYSADAFGEGWAAIVRAKWTDHNGGGWTWNGLCGVHMAWRSLTTRSVAVSSEAVDLHPATADLVDRFSVALKDKLAKAQEKYGYIDSWMADDWQGELIAKLVEHVEKGDPRDVAAFCAFAWHHGWSITPPLNQARKPEGAAHEAGEVEAMRTAIMTIVGAVRDYLPPVGTSDATLISAVIEAVDNPSINPVIWSIENVSS